MTPHDKSSWQITLTDLSLILFATTASATAQPEGSSGEGARVGVPVAVADGHDIDRWLAQQPRDPRQRLTITASYAPGGLNAALAGAQRLAGPAQQSGKAPRIIIQPARTNELSAYLTFDQPARSPS